MEIATVQAEMDVKYEEKRIEQGIERITPEIRKQVEEENPEIYEKERELRGKIDTIRQELVRLLKKISFTE